MKKTSLLAVDIGNTTVALGLFQGKRLAHHGKMLTHQFPTQQAWQRILAQWFRSRRIIPSQIENCIICSVVPEALSLLRPVLKKLIPPRTTALWVVGTDLKVPIPNLYRDPQQVGQDRLVNAYSGYVQYGAPLILVDFGTAVTFDIISKKGGYLGGLIVPGLEIARDVLAERTALLPKISLSPPIRIIGKTTQESIRSGLFYGWGALTDGVVVALKKEIGATAKLILTGGEAKRVSPFIKSRHQVNQHLTLQGLYFLGQKYDFFCIS